MKIKILIMLLFPLASFASDTHEIKLVKVESRQLSVNTKQNNKKPLVQEIQAPSRYQTSVTRGADGKLRTQCDKIHNHAFDRDVK